MSKFISRGIAEKFTTNLMVHELEFSYEIRCAINQYVTDLKKNYEFDMCLQVHMQYLFVNYVLNAYNLRSSWLSY